MSQGLLGLQDGCGQKRGRETGCWGSGAWRKGCVGWGLRPLEVRATLRKTREAIQAPTGCLSAQKRGAAPIHSHSHPNPSLLASSRRPKTSLWDPGTPAFPQWEAARAAPSPWWGQGPSKEQRCPHPHPGARSGLGRPARLPSRASRASRPGLGALRLPPSSRRRRSAAGRPAPVAGSRGPPAARSARSEAIARRTGEEERRR